VPRAPASSRRVPGFERPAAVDMIVDGASVRAVPGESVAAALVAAGVYRLGASVSGRFERGAFCFMGVCHSCMVEVEGRRVRACLEPVRAGLRVTTGRAVDAR
jgi:predicted molibdopterin-dependent oxidoreductase YjgC